MASQHNQDPVVVPLLIQRTDNGEALRMASPLLPGWVAVAQGPRDILRALLVAINEAEMARYAADRGYVYDAAPFVGGDAPPLVLRAVRPLAARPTNGIGSWRVSHDPAAWAPLPDGRWRSPSGSYYQHDSQVVERIIRLRRDLGLAVRHPDAPTELPPTTRTDPLDAVRGYPDQVPLWSPDGPCLAAALGFSRSKAYERLWHGALPANPVERDDKRHFFRRDDLVRHLESQAGDTD